MFSSFHIRRYKIIKEEKISKFAGYLWFLMLGATEILSVEVCGR